MNIPVPRKTPEFELVETMPPVAAASSYDMVEQMHFLYVNVGKARDLPVMDNTGSLDPYVEVKVGNQKGVTKHLEKNQIPVWSSVFAFSKDKLESELIEVTVKHKDTEVQNEFVGQIVFDATKVPLRVSPESSPAPQWYKLEDKEGQKVKEGEIMLAVWMGTQADEAFPEAWHSDANISGQQSLADTRSKIYFSPNLYYLRIHVIRAKDLLSSEKGRQPIASVKVQVGNQQKRTKSTKLGTSNPVWDEEMIFVVADHSDEYTTVVIQDEVEQGREEVIGRLLIPVREVPQREEITKLPDSQWFNLQNPLLAGGEGKKKKKKKKKVNFHGRICLCICIEADYHVFDEPTEFSSDFHPSSKHLRSPSIGILELGILSARNLLPMKKCKDGLSTRTDAYCAAKYSNKWARTRTILDTITPHWNEKYTWKVYDPCTVITIGVFDNCHISTNRENVKDQRIGKVRIRLSTLVTNRIYAYFYPLLVLKPHGLKKHGELHLTVRFTCTAWRNMVTQYSRPLLPKMHFVQPITERELDWMQYHAFQIVAARLYREEPPLQRETVEYMLDMTYHPFSLRKFKANLHRIMSLLYGISAICQCFRDICHWKNPLTTIFVHVLFFIQVRHPASILPNIFLCFFIIGLWNYQFKPRDPLHLDAQLSLAQDVNKDELDEEFDTFPTTRPTDVVKMRYTRLRSVAGWIQSVGGDVATQGERALSILSWCDPRATVIIIIFAFFCAAVLYLAPIQVAQITGLYLLRHPLFRSKLPSVAVNFFNRTLHEPYANFFKSPLFPFLLYSRYHAQTFKTDACKGNSSLYS